MNNINKSFEELWQELSSNKEVVELEQYNMKADKSQKWILPIFLVVILFLWINPMFTGLALAVFCVVFLIVKFIKNSGNINKMQTNEKYENFKVISDKYVTIPIAKNFFENVVYFRDNYITDEEYREGFREFAETRQYFESEYLLTGSINLNNHVSKIKLSQIMHGEGAGENNIKGQVISGSVLIMELSIKTRKNLILESNANLNKVYNMEFKSFEEIYNIKTEEDIRLEKLLTIENKNKILELVNKHKCIVEVSLKNDKLYIRFNDLCGFPILLQGQNEAKVLYNYLVSIKEITETITNIVIETIGDKV